MWDEHIDYEMGATALYIPAQNGGVIFRHNCSLIPIPDVRNLWTAVRVGNLAGRDNDNSIPATEASQVRSGTAGYL